MSYTFLESKKFAQVHIKNTLGNKNLSVAPFMNDGSSIFKKFVFLQEGAIFGNTDTKIAGTIRFNNDNFEGFDGTKWYSFNKNEFWEGDEKAVVCANKKIGINKNNPKKVLDVGGDVSIDQKIFVKDYGSFNNGIIIGESRSKSKEGMIRYYENRFEGFNGKEWITFSSKNNNIDDIKKIIDDSLGEKKEGNNATVERNELYFIPNRVTGTNINGVISYNFDDGCFEFIRKNIKNEDFLEFEDIRVGRIFISKNMDMENHSIYNVKAPNAPNDVATKEYVDKMCEGISSYYVVDYLIENLDIDNTSFICYKDLSLDEEVIIDDIFIFCKENIYFMTKVVDLKTENNEIFVKFGDESVINDNCKIFVKKGKLKNNELFFYYQNEKIFYQVINSEKSSNKTEKYKDYKFDEDYFSVIDDVVKLKDKEKIQIKNEDISFGCVSEGNLQDNIIKNNHLNPNIITEKEIVPGSISEISLNEKCIYEKHITAESINKESLQKKIIYSMHLNDNIIDGKNIKKMAIKTEHIGTNQIRTEHILENSINNSLLQKESVNEENISSKSIDNRHLKSSCITGYNIKENTVEGHHLVNDFLKDRHLSKNIVDSKHIKPNSIETSNLKNGIITGEKILEKTIDSNHLSEKSIQNIHLGNKIIKENNLEPNIIKSSHISKNCIKTNMMCTGSVTESILSDNSVSNSKIKSGTIDNIKLKNAYIKIDIDSNLTSNKVVNLGETLKISFNPNTYIPKKNDQYILLDDNLKIGKEDNNNEIICYSNALFEGSVEFNGEIKFKNDIAQVGEIKLFLENIELGDNWIPCDGRIIQKDNYPEIFQILNNSSDSYNIPFIESKNGVKYFIKIK